MRRLLLLAAAACALHMSTEPGVVLGLNAAFQRRVAFEKPLVIGAVNRAAESGGCVGGKGQGARFNDVYVLDMSTKDCAWSTPVCSGAIPTPRQDVALCASDGVVYLHAGRDNFVRDDLYALDLSDRANPAWEELAVSGRRPMPCYGHELAFVDGKLWTYGGFDELGGQCSKVYRLDFTENVSKRG